MLAALPLIRLSNKTTGVGFYGFPLKPYWVRTVNLSQGLEWASVEVNAKSFFMDNQLYNAIARAKVRALAVVRVVAAYAI